MTPAQRPCGGAARRGASLLILVLAMLAVPATSSAAGGARGLEVPVLMYHRISPPPAGTRLPALWVAPGRFRAHMRALHQRGWQTITARELAEAVRRGRTVGPRRFVVTFDDGARDGYRHAAPVMERFGMRGTFCVTPGRARKAWQISFRQMRDLMDRGHEIANHSWDHADLTSVGPVSLRRQVRTAARVIERRTGQAPRSFCYPFGRHDAAVRREVRASGHAIAFTTVEGARQSRRDTMRSPRIRVSGSTSPAALVARLQPYARGGGPDPARTAGPTAGREPRGSLLTLRAAVGASRSARGALWPSALGPVRS